MALASFFSRPVSLRRTLAISAAAVVISAGAAAAYHAHQKSVDDENRLLAYNAARLARAVSTYLVLHGSEIEGDAMHQIPPVTVAASQVFSPDQLPEISVERAGTMLHAQALLLDIHVETFCDEKTAKPSECTSVMTDGTKVIGQIGPDAQVAVAAETISPLQQPNAVSGSDIDPEVKGAQVVLTTTASWAGLPAGLRMVGIVDTESLRYGNLALCIQHVVAQDGTEPLKLKEGGPQCLARAIVPPSAAASATQRFANGESRGRLVMAPGLPFVVYSRDPNDPRG